LVLKPVMRPEDQGGTENFLNMAKHLPVLIVGGGIGGMAAALALTRAGRQVEIIEINPAWRALGAGLTLNGGALRALARLDLLEPVMAAGYSSVGGTKIFDAGGALLSVGSSDPLFGDGVPNLGGILRPRLHEVLRDAVIAAMIVVRLDVSITGLTEGTDSVDVTTSDGWTGTYSFVIGADGLLSRTRELVFPEFTRPRFTGQGCWRAVVPRPADVTASMVYMGERIKAGFNPISNEEMYVYVLESQPGNPWIAEEEWIVQLRGKLEGFHGHFDVIREGLGENSQINYRPLEVILLPDPWYRGHVLLIGDAAHATTPHVGYGAGLAIEDAVVLGELAAQSLSTPDLFTQFMARRHQRCRVILEGSVALGDMEMAGAPPSDQRAKSAELNAVIQRAI
jgi:2-polyprenyl-6-methoxyphenol hydroxylase-like FAD-dependent oxidoreductase